MIELLVVAVIIAFVLAMLMPGLARSQARAHGVFCMNNLKQLQIGWTMYAEDHQDWLPGVAGGSFPGPGKWVSGWLDFSSSSDNTNTIYLSDHRYSQLAAYLKSVTVFRCPSDQSNAQIGGHTYHRVRSVSMNCWMNYVGSSSIGQDEYQVFRKFNQIVDPAPSKAWVFIDEREDSINDGLFQTNLKNRGGLARIVDYPASYHNRAAGIAFADGHGDIKHWTDRRTTPEMKTGQLVALDVPSPFNADVAWFQEHSSSSAKMVK